MTFVTKFDGRKESFQKQKVYNTALRMGLADHDASDLADKIESKIYDGIQTKKILQMVFDFAKEYKPEIRQRIDLRQAIGFLRPKPDFETFVTLLLEEEGYNIVHNQIVSGNCVDHEIDDIAKKGDETIYVEVKHHMQYHTFTGVGVFLEVQATFEDMIEGFENKKNKYNFTKALVILNTKLSEHARMYAKCKGIDFIAWKDPVDNGLEKRIEERKLYPITLLKNLDSKTEAQLGDSGIVLLKQLVEMNPKEIARMTKISANKISDLARRARKLLS
jgi:Holliday junction resolvase-like predicted endonuclease